MKKEIFKANSYQEAYKNAKKKYGEDTLLLAFDEIKENKEYELTLEIKKSNLDIQKIIKLFKKRGLCEDWLEEVSFRMRGELLGNDEDIVSHILNEIDKNIDISQERENSIKMCVGTTGVGKTTTVAKLASYYKFEKNLEVAILNLDICKIGAKEQIEEYSSLLDIKTISIYNEKELLSSINRIKENIDVILIDTTGFSIYETENFLSLISILKQDINLKIEIELLLPAYLSYEDMQDIYDHFSFLNLNSIILTKLDETRRVGKIINFLLNNNTSLSYFSVGKKVPEDIFKASKEYLLERFIEEN